MKPMMHNLLDMAVFAKVVQLQSFSAAATYLEVSRSSVSKHVANLEKSLGVRLLTRTTRRLHLTDAGAAVFEHGARICQEAEAGEVTAGLYASNPRGLVRLSCAGAFGRLHVVPALPALLARYPDLEIELVMTDRSVDLVSERLDIAITSDALPSVNLAVRRLVPIRSFVCATDDYLQKHGMPQVPQDLQSHNCISYRSPVTLGRLWRFRRDGQDFAVPIKGNFSANNNEGLREAALQGFGIALLPGFVLGPQHLFPVLRPLLTDYETVGLFDSHILLHYVSGRRTPPKVRACVDFFADYFSKGLRTFGAMESVAAC
jgi:DNA-binding transcriptional LysR family regulator